MNVSPLLTEDDMIRLSVIQIEGKFARIRCTVACWARGEFDEADLARKLAAYTTKNTALLEPPRKLTVNGLPALELPLTWREG
jgi:hypothetical protein